MTLTPGTKLGPYEIQDAIGAGGMGEVYRAKDSKLDRTVAVKVLPEEVAGDKDRLSRFEREAKAVAALSHPNILAIHDFGRDNGTAYAVMELLEGETLKDRLENGAIVERKAIEIAAQMARGLGAAHEKQIVHRDLKPDNVFLTGDGQVKLLDFGLAKVGASRSATADAKTIGSGTDPGKVMGTVGYMSPEQVRGDAADHRSDIFAFGVLLYEMLSGRRAFQKDSAVETMSAILREEPEDLSASGVHVPPALDRVVRRCLEKQPGERFQSARDLAFALENASGTSMSKAQDLPIPSYPTGNRLWRAIPYTVLFALGILTGITLYQRSASPPATEPVKVRPLTFSGRDASPAASPDGKLIALRSDRDGMSRIWVKQLAGGGEEPLTDGPDFSPQFHPDGSSVLFLRQSRGLNSAYRVALVGGKPRKLIDDVIWASWSPDGDRIAFVRSAKDVGAISSTFGIANAQGTEERELAILPNYTYSHLSWSPDGTRISAIEAIPTGATPDSILILDLETGNQSRVGTASGYGSVGGLTWNGTGNSILFAQSGSLIGDQSGALSRVLLHDVGSGEDRLLFWASNLFPSAAPYSTFTILERGTLVFDDARVTQNLVEFSIEGGTARGWRQWAHGNARDRQPAYSPDGKSIIFSSNRSGNLDLWILSVEAGTVHQMTDDAAHDWDPGFSPDGESIVWSSDRTGNLEIWTANRDGSQARQLTRDGRDAENPTVTPDGWVVYWSSHPEKRGIWKIRTDGTEATRLLEGNFNITDVSPDGRYVAFISNNLANFRVTLHFIDVETGDLDPARVEMTTPVGASGIGYGRPRWMPDSKSFAYVGVNEEGLTGIYVQDFVPGKDTRSSRRPLAGFASDYISESFDISPDGKRLTLAVQTETYNIMIAEGVPGIEPPARDGN